MSDPDIRLAERFTRAFEALRRTIAVPPGRDPMLDIDPRGERPRLRVVDEVPEELHRALTGGASLELVPLPEVDATPADEQTETFRTELDRARIADLEYRTRLAALDAAAEDHEFELARLDRWLRDRVREDVGLRPRADIRSFDGRALAKSKGIDPALELPAQPFKFSHQDKRIQTLLLRDDLEATMARLGRAAALAEQEAGCASLHLAFGALEWSQGPGDTPRLAPLLLLPVQVERRAARNGVVFALSTFVQAAEVNAALRAHLRQDWEVALPPFEIEELGELSIERWFEDVRAAIAGLPRWSVRRRVVLGNFVDGRAAMFDDLDPAHWTAHPSANGLVRAILAGFGDTPARPARGEGEGARPAPLLVHEADPYQRQVIAEAAAGRDVVVDGGPGTGKTQTLANIVANAIAGGQSVLVVSHKLAALDALAARLAAAGLGDACLELSSDRIDARRVVEQLKRRFYISPEEARALPLIDRAGADTARRTLAAYTDALHAPAADGTTPFQAIWRSVQARADLTTVHHALQTAPLPDALTGSAAATDRGAGLIADLVAAGQRFEQTHGALAESPWPGLIDRLPAGDVDRLPDLLAQAREAARAALATTADAAALGIPPEALDRLPGLLAALAEPPADLAGIERLTDLDTDRVRDAVERRRELIALEAELAAVPALAGIGDDELEAALGAAAAVWPPDRLDAPLPQVRAEAASFMRLTEEVSAAVAGFLPAIDLLALDPEVTAADLEPYALAAAAVATLPADLRRVLGHDHASAEELKGFGAAIDALRQSVQQWRALVPAYGHGMLVSTHALREAADLLRRTGPGRWNAGLSGSVKAARALAARLLLPAESPSLPELMEGWAAHLDEVSTFLAGPARSAAGRFWDGFDTPFSLLAIAADVRARLTAALGAGVTARVCALTGPELDRLADLAEAGATFRQFAAERPDILGPRPVREVVGALAAIREGARAFLERAPERALSDLPVPISQIAALGPLERRRRAIAAGTPAGPETDLVAGVSDPEGLDRLLAQAGWVDAVRAADPPAAAAAALLTGDAPVLLARLRGLTDIANDGLAAGRAAVGALARLGLAEPGDDPESVIARCEALLDRVGQLDAVRELARLEAALREAKLGPFLAAATEAGVAGQDLPAVFRSVAAERRAGALRAELPDAAALDGHCGLLVEQDALKLEADRLVVRQRLLQAKPSPGSAAGPKRQWTEAVLLRNEFVKTDGTGRRFTPLRELIRRAPQTLRAFRPCLLAPPLAVARFLPRDMRFDLLVVEAAAQTSPAAVLGAALRARQIVVVGDSRELPPGDVVPPPVGDGAPEDPAADARLSLLEVAARGFGGCHALRAHHASRHHGLVAFAASAVHGGGLVTFPDVVPDDLAVDVVPVGGVPSRGMNPAEAQRVAEEAVAFMIRFADVAAERVPSLLILAPERAQRDLIDDEVRRLSAGNEAAERYLAKAGRRALAVKTLDTAQGDSADHVFASLTYGPETADGSLVHALGAFAQQHGDRRVHLVATRARERLTLFTSMRSEQLRADATGPPGPRLLAGLLAHAERGGRAIVAEPAGPLARELVRALGARRIPAVPLGPVAAGGIAVAVPGRDEQGYAAGLVGDGPDAATAALGDPAFEPALRRRGWQVVRQWSVEWFDDPDAAAERLAARLAEMRTQRVPRPEPAFRAFGVLEPDAAPETAEQRAAIAQVSRLVEQDAGLAALFATPALAVAGMPARPRPTLDAGPRPALTREQTRRALELFRERRIDTDRPRRERHRSILRPQMIEVMLAMRLDEPLDFARKTPAHLARSVDPRELRYLPEICAIIARMKKEERA